MVLPASGGNGWARGYVLGGLTVCSARVLGSFRYWKSHLENEVNRATSVGFESVMERIRELDDVVTRQRHRNAAHILRLRDHIVTKRAENDALAKQISTTRSEINVQMSKEERVTRSDAATKWHYETIRNERLIAKWTEEIKEVQRAATQKHTPLYRVMAQYVAPSLPRG